MNDQSVDLNDQGTTMNLKLPLSKTLIGLSLCLLVACGGGSSSTPAPVITDTDADGVADTADAFPNDAAESADADSDNVGDNAEIIVQTLPTKVRQMLMLMGRVMPAMQCQRRMPIPTQYTQQTVTQSAIQDKPLDTCLFLAWLTICQR